MKSVIYLLAVAALAFSGLAQASHTDYAQVYRVEPVYTSDHNNHCRPSHKGQYFDVKRQWGNKHHGRVTINKERGPVVRYHAGHKPRHRHHPNCCHKTQYRVWYYYQGQQYQDLMPFHPGNKLRIRIDITPLVHGY